MYIYRCICVPIWVCVHTHTHTQMYVLTGGARTISRCLLLQHTATQWKTLQHTASHCNVIAAAYSCNTLQHTATHCNALQHD